MFRKLHRLLLPALLVAPAFAKTDLSGCTTTDISSPAGASVAWYVPGTGEICALLDCGGGRAPARTDVPGCPLYSGTATYSPSYLLGFGSTTAAAASSSSWSSETLDTESSSWDLYTTPATAPIGVLPSAYPTDSLSAMTTGKAILSACVVLTIVWDLVAHVVGLQVLGPTRRRHRRP